jgi:hypothetical protein
VAHVHVPVVLVTLKLLAMHLHFVGFRIPFFHKIQTLTLFAWPG